MSLIGNSSVGGLTSNKGVMCGKVPFLVVTRKANYNPNLQESIEGYPINGTYKLSALSGYTRVKEIHLRGIPATDEEINELESILKSGVNI